MKHEHDIGTKFTKRKTGEADVVELLIEFPDGNSFEVSFRRDVSWNRSGDFWEGEPQGLLVLLGKSWLTMDEITRPLRVRIEDAVLEWCEKNEPEPYDYKGIEADERMDSNRGDYD